MTKYSVEWNRNFFIAQWSRPKAGRMTSSGPGG
jgi:hypothetical protein